MNLFFISEARFVYGQDGKVYYVDKSFGPDLWRRYLNVFNHIYVIARIAPASEQIQTQNMCCAELENVSFITMPYGVGFRELIKNLPASVRLLKEILLPGNAYICRVPGFWGTLSAFILKSRKIPYGVEVVGDPWDLFAPNPFNVFKFRRLIRITSFLLLKLTVKYAHAAIYVTKSALQKRYPASNAIFSTYASNVFLPPEAFSQPALKNRIETFSILTIGSLAQMYKAPDIAIAISKILKSQNIKFHWTWIGAGKYLEEMQQLATQENVSDVIEFIGGIANAPELRKYLFSADLFVLPSRTEGLPRAMIEAMAAGLACVGTNVGGIKELISEEWLTAPDKPQEMAQRIISFIQDCELLFNAASINFNEAQDYKISLIQQRRNDFQKALVSCVINCQK